MTDIEIIRKQNLIAAQLELDYIKEEFNKIKSTPSGDFNRAIKSNHSLAELASKYLSIFRTKHYSGLLLNIKKFALIPCGNPDCTNIASTLVNNCCRKCCGKNPVSISKNAIRQLERYNAEPIICSKPYISTDNLLLDNLNDRERNLILSQDELDYIKNEFIKHYSHMASVKFNQLIGNNQYLATLALKYFKTFKVFNYSGFRARIIKHDLISCANPGCPNIASIFVPNCSVRCGVLNPESRAKLKATNIEKYGVSQVLQAVSVQEKMKATSLQRYGVEFSQQSKVFRDKAKASCIKKYGVDNPQKSKIIRNKSKTTCLLKYGVVHGWQSKEIRDKIKTTCLEKYGVANAAQATTVKIRTKRRLILQKWDLLVLNNLIKVITSKEEFESGAELKIKCISCDAQLEHPQLRCFDCYPLRTNFEQNAVRDYIMSLGVEVIENDRTTIKKDESSKHQEIDILIPSKKIGIEYNGIYWHSEKMKKSANYHADKTKASLAAGYRLIHIFSDQWKSRQEIVKKRLRHILGLETRTVYARKCAIEEISSAEAKVFLNENHIQGAGNAKIRLALKYEGEIVAAMTFSKPRFNKNYDYEMIRFATSCNVPGGGSKLLAAFKKQITSASIITYADKSWSDGNLYRQLGFTELKDSAPNYFWTNEKETYKRYETMKHKLPKLLQDFDINLSESENMTRNGFYKIHDCGNKVFELKY